MEARLDGIADYNYWFGMGREALKAEALTPGMLAAIKKMLANPEEALWVVDGALMVLSLSPAKETHGCLPLIGVVGTPNSNREGDPFGLYLRPLSQTRSAMVCPFSRFFKTWMAPAQGLGFHYLMQFDHRGIANGVDDGRN